MIDSRAIQVETGIIVVDSLTNQDDTGAIHCDLRAIRAKIGAIIAKTCAILVQF
ncbi:MULTISPECIES: hypothetical protein [Robertmurraya]|uniref:hypothetical protein n=1 Tax=Robertmurraya TaxID=2837507 RepID=UPI001BB401CF|nr:hypothetical protein [Robertmurraya siralis]